MYIVTVDNLLKISNPIIIDIRPTDLYNISHIPNSINIPNTTLQKDYKNQLNKINTYYLYCDQGFISSSICTKLNKLGYNIYSIKGGYQEFVKLRKL